MLLKTEALTGLFAACTLAEENWCTFNATVDMRCVIGWTTSRAKFKISEWKNENGRNQKLSAPMWKSVDLGVGEKFEGPLFKDSFLVSEFSNATGVEGYYFHHMKFDYMGFKFEETRGEQCKRSWNDGGWFNCKDNPPTVGPSRRVPMLNGYRDRADSLRQLETYSAIENESNEAR
ncbi:hypothetical protein CC86DRAFT_381234 [Ophiobolus disseminans]|uniref:Uncharacterized protein n=1 Tax=Ophiobolus disseminans TaxID=1469910 RepID=A0A6A7A225_9PLEO|nr:hypothetical protein CC86DRAFT_381234 [Ophiobolus disseminans]